MFDTKSTNRLGNDGMLWFYGVVEDIEDPLQIGRVRVRILGDHSQSKNLIPTEDLPWAYVINDIHSSSMQGIGHSPTGLYVLGSWVFGFYGDGIDKQQPIIQGSFGGIPESIPWKPSKKADEEGDESLEQDDEVNVGFQDPNEEFPMGEYIFEQDTNRLARNAPDDHAFEIPEDLVPELEKMIEDGLCPEKPVYGKEYYDKFDEAYVRKFGQGEEEKLKCDDTVVGNDQCNDQQTKELKVEDKEDQKCQYFLDTNNHPFTVYKFINRERFIPKAKVFADPMHREYWHEPDNPWATKYPYNRVWEGYHKKGTTSVNNPGKIGTGQFVSESYGYDKTIEDYDGSDKEGIYRKQTCGVGSWGLGEEWDSTEGAQRYHRFHPSANYFEIDNDGNETRKIYGDSFEIDLKDRSILIKGDWNITVEGDKNELIEGDYNLQVMGNKNTDVRGDIMTHADGKNEWHFKEECRLRVDSDYRVRVSGNKNTSILKKDYIESEDAERRANTIIRKGAASIEDEGFVDFSIKAHNMLFEVCNLKTQVEDWVSEITTMDQKIVTFDEKIGTFNQEIAICNRDIGTYTKEINTLTENYGTLTSKRGSFNEHSEVHNEFVTVYNGCIAEWFLECVDFKVLYESTLEFAHMEPPEVFDCGTPDSPSVPSDVSAPPSVTFDEKATYPETDGIQKCLVKYNECIEAAKGACMTTLKDPRTLEDYTRFDWEKYHASIDSCKRSYEACVEANKGKECDICSPTPGTLVWECMPDHDPNCPTDDKEYEFYNCDCACHGKKEKKEEDPWLESEQETP